MKGWIKIFRTFENWEYYQDSNMVHLFIHLLIKANSEDGMWRGKEIKRGQLITGRKKLSDQTGISERTIRTCLERLKSTNELTIETTKQFSTITICKYESYQVNKNRNDQETDLKKANRTPLTRREEEKKKRIINTQIVLSSIDDRTKTFSESLNQFSTIYPKQMLNEFFNYWSEPNKSKTKMRFELEKTWDLNRRLIVWQSRVKMPFSNNFQKPEEKRRANPIAI